MIDPTEEVTSHQDPKHHISSPASYVVIFGLLMIGTIVTVIASRIDLGVLNTPIALGIAVAKATLVILYFMHVRYSTRLTWVIVIGSFMWLGVMFVLTYTDILTRSWDTFG